MGHDPGDGCLRRRVLHELNGALTEHNGALPEHNGAVLY